MSDRQTLTFSSNSNQLWTAKWWTEGAVPGGAQNPVFFSLSRFGSLTSLLRSRCHQDPKASGPSSDHARRHDATPVSVRGTANRYSEETRRRIVFLFQFRIRAFCPLNLFPRLNPLTCGSRFSILYSGWPWYVEETKTCIAVSLGSVNVICTSYLFVAENEGIPKNRNCILHK